MKQTSWVNSGLLAWGSDSPVSEELSTWTKTEDKIHLNKKIKDKIPPEQKDEKGRWLCCWYLETPALDHPDVCRDPVSELDLDNVSEGQLLHCGDHEHNVWNALIVEEIELLKKFHLGLHSDLFTVPPGDSVLWDKVLESLHDLGWLWLLQKERLKRRGS